jgi:quinol monooxygenase YgiN
MAIRHLVTIQVAPGKTADFAAAFRTLQTATVREEGCEQYELFQSFDDPDKVVLLERWANQEHLDRHMEAERTADASRVDAIVALWAPGTTPTVERFES